MKGDKSGAASVYQACKLMQELLPAGDVSVSSAQQACRILFREKEFRWVMVGVPHTRPPQRTCVR